MNKVSLKINESALIKNLKFAFSNSFTVVTELLQNARRAGATKIIISTAMVNGEMVMTVQDDGCGIADFQKLLTVAESGWDESIQADESPFGMGFLSALFVARKVVVESHGRTLDLDTEHLLSMNDVVINPVSEFIDTGTRVTLFGIKKNAVEDSQIANLVRGFNIPVVLNDKNLPRPYALDGDSFFLTSIGWVNCDPEKEILQNTQSYTAYLQGFKVLSSVGRDYDGSVKIHLNSKQFFARMPDRDKLVDEKAAAALIKETMTSILLEWCEAKLKELGGDKFAKLYGENAFSMFPALLNKLDFVPACLLSKPERIACFSVCHENQRVDTNITREQLQSGEIQLIEEPGYCDAEENINVWQWLDKNDKVYMLDMVLPADHWAKEYVLSLVNKDVQIEPVSLGRSAEFSGNCIGVTVALCDAVKMVCNGQEIIVRNAAVYALAYGIMVPTDSSNHIGDIAESIERYSSEHDDFLENDLDQDAAGINNVVARLRTQNFSKAITETLNDAGLSLLDGIQGKQYLVTFSDAKPENRYRMDSICTVDLNKVLAELGVSEDQFNLAVKKVTESENITEA